VKLGFSRSYGEALCVPAKLTLQREARTDARSIARGCPLYLYLHFIYDLLYVGHSRGNLLDLLAASL
jgi:hypothetical protein